MSVAPSEFWQWLSRFYVRHSRSRSVSTYDVLIEGNTDNVPISQTNIRNNWDLSALRASSVVQVLQKHMPEKQAVTVATVLPMAWPALTSGGAQPAFKFSKISSIACHA